MSGIPKKAVIFPLLMMLLVLAMAWDIFADRPSLEGGIFGVLVGYLILVSFYLVGGFKFENLPNLPWKAIGIALIAVACLLVYSGTAVIGFIGGLCAILGFLLYGVGWTQETRKLLDQSKK